MPYITREDGERFIIPSYRDTLNAKKQAILKKEILLLSQNYGEYITLQKKGIDQFEAAFSPDAGYLLGETVWHYFKRPEDLIYCEAIPNTSEAILVIVKGGSVYLDGSFPVDSIPEELVIFRTQKNNFEIYIHGDIPLSNTPEEGKFALDASSIKSFSVLPEPVFPTLPKIKTFQLRLVDVVLKEQGIGIFPIKPILILLAVAGLIWVSWMFLTAPKKEVAPPVFVNEVNPNQSYIDALSTPDPADQITELSKAIELLYTIPGWRPDVVVLTPGNMQAKMKSFGIRTNVLEDWVSQHQGTLTLANDGFYISLGMQAQNRLRPSPSSPQPLQMAIAKLIDRISFVIPGNQLTLGTSTKKGIVVETQLTIAFNELSFATFSLLGEQLRNLPLVLTKVTVNLDNNNLSGTINLKALGS